MRMVNSLPLPGPSLATVTLPSCISTSERTTVSPIPRPPRDRESVWSAWTNISKSLGRSSGAIPIPLSMTLITTCDAVATAVSSICPPVGVYFAALFSRLRQNLGQPRRVDFAAPPVLRKGNAQLVAVVFQ